MDYYISKLTKCGYDKRDAYIIYHEFLKDFSIFDLISYIKSLEKEVCKNVDRI